MDDGEFFLPTSELTSTRANSTPHPVSNDTGLPKLAEVPDLSKTSPSSSKQTHISDLTQLSDSLLEQLANTPDLSETLKVLPEQTDAFLDPLLEQLANAADDIQTSDLPSLPQSADATATATLAELQDRAVRLLPIRGHCTASEGSRQQVFLQIQDFTLRFEKPLLSAPLIKFRYALENFGGIEKSHADLSKEQFFYF
jgi:hypothetical protein